MFTLFVDNLPQGYSSFELRNLFSNHGYIADAYVPHIQRCRVNGRFGFVEVLAWEQGERLIHEVDGKEVGSMKVKVKWAKYPRRRGHLKDPGLHGRGNEQSEKWNSWKKGAFPTKMIDSRLWGTKQQPARVTMIDEPGKLKKTAKVVTIEELQDNLEWLDRSLTCISDKPRDVESLRLMINSSLQQEIEVRDLGKFKFLLTLESKEIKERIKSEGVEKLKQWFTSVSDWAEHDVCQTRRIWLEIVGLPIQLWSEENIRKIAENWGDVVLVEEEASKLKSFASAKVIIDTLCMNPIDEEAIIQVKHKGFRVSIFEAKTEFTIFHTGPIDEISSGSPISKDKGRIAGTVSAGNIEDQAHLDHAYCQKDHSIGAVHGGYVDGQAQGGSCNLNSNLNSNGAHHEEQHREHPNGVLKSLVNENVNQESCRDGLIVDRLEGEVEGQPLLPSVVEAEQLAEQVEGRILSNEAISYSSSTKTKVAQLSGNDYSEEMRKINCLSHEQSRFKQAADFEVEVNQQESCSVMRESEISAPPGFNIRKNLAPLGFEGSASPHGSTDRKAKASRRPTAQSVGRRVTRSQIKKGKKQTVRYPTKGAGTSSRKSIETTESMRKLAEEALEIGEILGVKVISHKANAIKRITDSLKSNRSRQ